MISIISSLYKGIKEGTLEKDYLKGCYYFLESIAESLLAIAIGVVILICK